MKKVKFIYNPFSGESALAGRLDEIIDLYQRHGYLIVPYRLDFGGDPADMFFDVSGRYHHILIAGGDGTINYVVNEMKRQGVDATVAILPTGTANDFASMLGIPSDPVKACQSLLAGRKTAIDLGRVNGHYFVNVLSCGLFTDVSQKTPTILKNTLGKLAYYAAGITELTRFRSMHVKVESDGGNFQGNCVIFFVFNGRTAGNLRLAYLSKIDDGLLDVLIVKGDNPLGTIQTAIRYLPSVQRGKKYPPGIEHIQCSRLTAECYPKEPTDIDGQAGPDFPLEITCEKAALNILLPVPARRRRGR